VGAELEYVAREVVMVVVMVVVVVVAVMVAVMTVVMMVVMTVVMMMVMMMVLVLVMVMMVMMVVMIMVMIMAAALVDNGLFASLHPGHDDVGIGDDCPAGMLLDKIALAALSDVRSLDALVHDDPAHDADDLVPVALALVSAE
jgi:hypothetical protein